MPLGNARPSETGKKHRDKKSLKKGVEAAAKMKKEERRKSGKPDPPKVICKVCLWVSVTVPTVQNATVFCS